MNKFMMRLSNALALFGGMILLFLVLITVISVLGRSANTIAHMDFVEAQLPLLATFLSGFGPILGDFELVEAGVAVAIMAFLPICQLKQGHATVELFTHMFPVRFSLFLASVWEVLFAFVLIVITWRLFIGTSDKMRYGETTFLLQFPVWWGYALCSVIGVLASVVAVYSAWLRIRRFLERANDAPGTWGADP